MQDTLTVEELVTFAKRLSTVDKVRLIEQIAPEIKRDLDSRFPQPRPSLRGLWQGIEISEEDIADARREMWNDFPREDM